MVIASSSDHANEGNARRAMGQETRMSSGTSMKRGFLQAIIATLILAAVVGIYVFLFGSFGKTEAKILGTTLTICYFSITSLACSAAFEKKRHPLLFIPGLALGIAGFLLYVPSIWAEGFEVKAIGKAMAIVGVLSFSFAQACLLSLAPLQRRQVWVFFVAVASILALAAIISGVIIREPHDEQWLVRIIGVVAILDGCLSLCVPILHRLGSKQMAEKADEYNEIELVCPRCGQRGSYPLGNIKCPKCSLGIQVQIGSVPECTAGDLV
jgi:hypothetical protein